MARKLKRIPLLGLQTGLPAYLRKDGGMAKAHNVIAVRQPSGEVVWRPLPALAGQPVISGLLPDEKVLDITLHRQPALGDFSTPGTSLERYIVLTSHRLGLMQPVRNGGGAGPGGGYPNQYELATIAMLPYNLDRRALFAFVTNRVIVTTLIGGRPERTFIVVGDFAWELPVPRVTRDEITLTQTDGPFDIGMIGVRAAWVLQDGSQGPWSTPIPVAKSTDGWAFKVKVELKDDVTVSWSQRTIDTTTKPHLIRGVRIAITDLLPIDVGDLFRTDYFVVGEVSLDFSASPPFAELTIDNLSAVTAGELAADDLINQHRIAGIPLVYNGRLWLGGAITDFAAPRVGDQIKGVARGEPLPPSSVRVASAPGGYPVVLWNPPNDDPALEPTGGTYRIYRQTAEKGASPFPPYAALVHEMGVMGNTIYTWTDFDVEPETLYYYWVATANQNGVESEWAGPYDYTTPPDLGVIPPDPEE